MARAGDMSVSGGAIKASLYELLQSLGFTASADALYAASGVVTIPRRLTDSRDGREEAIKWLGEAMDDPNTGVIIISDSKPISDVLQSLYKASVPTQGYT